MGQQGDYVVFMGQSCFSTESRKKAHRAESERARNVACPSTSPPQSMPTRISREVASM
eukprot:CAMPEP_0115861720 /NCGR_PEP_ID=MMETSP0287-20121206/17800_1 /TAXON_ID=412157 /ORGANISM="Chrysochromulina rotalis, Strain UIO044" /LENGTH=57 /DNA_ID=CAMNT_0003316107 /DNA_START=178 /DNA_END=351 /DNA_ORIENTATION=+